MKTAVLKYSCTINLGDEVQSIAASHNATNVDYYLDRDYLNTYSNEDEISLIANGWYMAKPENWPPSENIKPLFISFHLSNANNSSKILLQGANLNYFKQHAPIGCRDFNTLKLFEDAGVDAYYSGCVTLTLKNKFNKRNEKILSVDCFYQLGKPLQERLYASLFPKGIIDNVTFIEQDRPDIVDSKERFATAQNFLDELAQAKLVITSRIHTALPCLAFGTPVVFVNVGFHDQDRFNGLIDKMNQIRPNQVKYTGFSRYHRCIRKIGFDKIMNKKLSQLINWQNPPKNPVDISPIANNITQRIKEFLND